ncbi:helix-turn-helix domain-containing protein [Streptomyces sp. NPDC002896]|uniref:helix-turn-helix domain-containing protein n=1 Tax=Streptomyces sp. NPDC002896 TaxID=3154438 RepID=UPI00331772AD
MDPQQLAEYRYRAVREVLGGSPIGEVAARYGTSRQTLHTWRRRFEQEGMPGLTDRPRRPRTSPTRLSAEVETMICQLRRSTPGGAPAASPTSSPAAGWMRRRPVRRCTGCCLAMAWSARRNNSIRASTAACSARRPCTCVSWT